jgi:N-acetylmuramoyl-L-alanine amidase
MHRLARHSVLTVLFLAAASSSLLAQVNAIRVEFTSDPTRQPTTIGTFRRSGVTYASLQDLATVFSLGTYVNAEAGKFEIKRPPYRIKVATDNPFVIVSDQAGHQSVHQLPAGIVHAADAFFAPLASFLPFFSTAFDIPATFDPAANIVRIGAPVPANTFDISSLELTAKSNGMLIRIPSAKRLPDLESWLRPDGWFYLTIADAKADTAALNRVPPTGLVREIVAIQSPTSLQLTFRLNGKIATSEIIRSEDSNDILVSLRTPGADEKQLLARRKREIQAGLENQRKRWELDVIVIDAGHGGRDWGATGVTGVKEKDVTLGIALKLGKLIEKSIKGVSVVYTRKDDRFVELDRRGQIANEASGKLFISIHCNSLPHKPSKLRGFEVYLLRPGRTEEAIAIAERENAVIQMEEGYEKRYQELTEENFILVAMAQSAYVKASEVFADLTQQEIQQKTPIPNRGVKQAGFYVLVGAAMPNVLVETAYLSNRDDEKFLKSQAGQQKIAESLARAIKRYKEEYEKLLLEGKPAEQLLQQ